MEISQRTRARPENGRVVIQPDNAWDILEGLISPATQCTANERIFDD